MIRNSEMSYEEFAKPLWLEPRRSLRLLLIVAGSHSLGLGVAVGGPWPLTARLLLATGVLLSAAWVGHRYLGAARLSAAVWRSDGNWRVCHRGVWLSAGSVSPVHASPAWVILRFRLPGVGRRRLVIARDAVPAEAFRRLRVGLRTGGFVA